MRRSSESHLHQEVWANIPWMVNERLNGRERERAERHIPTCEVCRAELVLQRKLREVTLLETNIEVVPNASLHKLLARIDSGQGPASMADEPAAEEATVVPFPAPVAAIDRPKTMRTRWLVAAVVVQAVALTVLTSAFVRGEAERDAPFQVRSSGSHLPAGTIARVVFVPETTAAEMQTLLIRCGVQVSDGPTEPGVYSVRSASKTAVVSADSAASCLRSSTAVRFAEPHTE